MGQSENYLKKEIIYRRGKITRLWTIAILGRDIFFMIGNGFIYSFFSFHNFFFGTPVLAVSLHFSHSFLVKIRPVCKDTAEKLIWLYRESRNKHLNFCVRIQPVCKDTNCKDTAKTGVLYSIVYTVVFRKMIITTLRWIYVKERILKLLNHFRINHECENCNCFDIRLREAICLVWPYQYCLSINVFR